MPALKGNLTFGLLLCIALIVLYSSKGHAEPGMKMMKRSMTWLQEPRLPCDPTMQPGFVNEAGFWEPRDKSCQSNDFVNRLKDTPQGKWAETFPSLMNKTILLLGDSVSRQMWHEMCHVTNGQINVFQPDIGDAPPVDYSEASFCENKALNLRFTHFHQYGFANATDPTTLGYLKKCFPGGPHDFETRLPNLYATLLKDYPPDYIQVGGGAWDFLYMFNRDVLEKRHHKSMDSGDLRELGGKLRELLRFVQDMFPAAKVVFMKPQMLSADDLAAKHAWGGGYFYPPLDKESDSVLFPPLFHPLRTVQHYQALSDVAEEEGVDTLDYWKLKESMLSEDYWQTGDAIHPGTKPRVAMAEMILEKLHRLGAYGV